MNNEFVAIFHLEVCIGLLDMEAFPSSSSINISRSGVSGLIETDEGRGVFSCDKTVVDSLTGSTKLGNTMRDKQLCMWLPTCLRWDTT